MKPGWFGNSRMIAHFSLSSATSYTLSLSSPLTPFSLKIMSDPVSDPVIIKEESVVGSSSGKRARSEVATDDENTDVAPAMIDDEETRAAAAKAKAVARKRQPNDPWKLSELKDVATISEKYESKVDERKGKGGNFKMVFTKIGGSYGVNIQAQAKLAFPFAPFEDEAKRAARKAKKEGASVEASTKDAAESESDDDGDAKKKSKKSSGKAAGEKKKEFEDFNVRFERDGSPFFDVWCAIDQYVKSQCKINGQGWWGKTLTEAWFEDGYFPLFVTVDKNGAELNEPNVKLKVAVDPSNGMPCVEFKDETGEVRYRHTTWDKQQQQWDKDDADYLRKNGKPRAPFLSVEELQQKLGKGAVIRFIWNHRGYGYSAGLKKIANFGNIISIQLIEEAAPLIVQFREDSDE